MGFENYKRRETTLDSKETVIDRARELRRAQKARIAAPLGKQKSDAKETERNVAMNLGYAVDEYEKTLMSAAHSKAQP